MTGEVFAGRGAARLCFWLLLAVSALMLPGCQMFIDPDYDPAITPSSLQLQTAAESDESILDELPPGPAGDLAPPSYSPEELVAQIERERDWCAQGGEARDDHRERYRRYRKQLLDGATAEANALREAGRDPYEDERIKYMHEALIRLPENPDCRKRVVGYQPEFGASVEGGIGGMRVGLPSYRFLGTELGGIPNLNNGYHFEDDETASVQKLGGGFDLERAMLGAGRMRVQFGYTRTSLEADRNTGAFDPMGASLLIPGTGDGPFGAGFSLPTAGGLNVVTSSSYRLEYDSDDFYAKLMGEYWCDDDFDDDDPGLGTFPYLGLRYTSSDFRQRFGGSIPGFARDFEYNTDVDTKSWGPIAGVQVVKPVVGSPVMLRAGVTASVEFNDASGSDSLDFTGFGRQTMRLSNDDTTLSYTVNAGVTVGARSPIQFDIDAFAGSIGNTPVVTRDGVGPSRLEMERSDYVGAALRTTFRF
ncbi:MAG: hypothetical protein AMXMBFR74_23900 [Parvibaculum sp.]|uniref:hypothetical protein n=1 Tax=Parvibaculum sp. TaxID=2024848 RepID=UPI0035B716B3